MPETFIAFADFASSFRLTPPRDPAAYTEVGLSEVVWHDAASGSPNHFPKLWHAIDSPLSIEAFQKKLRKWLASLGVAVDDEVLGILTGVVAVLIEDGKDLVTSLTELKSSIKKVDVFHYHLLPTLGGDGWDGCFEWCDFRFERLDSKRIVYRCQRAAAPFLEGEAQTMDGAPCFKSPVFERQIIDVSDIFWRLRTPAIRRYGVAILEPYLQQYSLLHSGAMWEALDDAFLLPFAAGLHLINLQDLRRFPDAQTWTFYSKLGRENRHSWVGRNQILNRLRVPRFDQAQRALNKWSDRLNVRLASRSTLHPLIQAVSRSIVRSTNHLSASRIDESFLFLVIAIEQVFSETENTTKMVSCRTALVASVPKVAEWSKATKHVSELYGKRSRLVHAGKGVTIDDLLAISDLSDQVLACLLRLALLPESQHEGFHKSWLKRLDYLIAGIEAGKPPSDADLIENGIIDSPTP